MSSTLASSYRFLLAQFSDSRIDLRDLLLLAIERNTDLLLARFNRTQG